jgi:hypothetical protein
MDSRRGFASIVRQIKKGTCIRMERGRGGVRVPTGSVATLASFRLREVIAAVLLGHVRGTVLLLPTFFLT